MLHPAAVLKETSKLRKGCLQNGTSNMYKKTKEPINNYEVAIKSITPSGFFGDSENLIFEIENFMTIEEQEFLLNFAVNNKDWDYTKDTINENGGNELQVLGQATTNNVAMRFLTATTGEYKLMITDIKGSVRYNKDYNVTSEIFPITVSDLHLAPGMYVANMMNNGTASTVKFIVE